MIAKSKTAKLTKPASTPINKAADAVARIKQRRTSAGTSVGPSVAHDNASLADSRTLCRIQITSIDRHPDNRVPSPAAVDAMMISIIREGQLEPLVVRKIKDRYQLVSGETRWLALYKLREQKALASNACCDCHVLRDCDDARALELLAIYNAARSDLNAIEKAGLIKRLCDPTSSGGAGMTREQAAKIYGLETGAAASNLVRLLELPQVWRDRVASGELPQTFARALLPFAHASRLLDKINQEWLKDSKATSEWDKEWLVNRADFERNIVQIVEENIRPLGKTKMWYRHHEFDKLPSYHYSGEYPCLFKMTEELEAKLDIVELTIGKKTDPWATNTSLHDQLQIPLIIKKVDEKSKSSAKTSAGDEKPQKKPLTAAEQKKANALKQDQLNQRIAAWRHQWLQKWVVQAMISARAEPWIATKFLTWFTTATSAWRFHIQELIKPALKSYKVKDVCDINTYNYGGIVVSYAAELLSVADPDPKRPNYPTEIIEALARDYQIVLESRWEKLEPAELETFLLLHQCDQLDYLGKEWDVYFPESANKSGRIKLLMAKDKRIKMPSSIAPLKRSK